MPRPALALSLALAAAAPAQHDANPIDPALCAELRYRCVGPTRGGRVTAVAGAVQRPGTFFFGATGGGVFRTTDFGASWQCVSDGFFGTCSIGAVRVAPSNPDVVWVGTGSDGLRSNVISGDGVYRSTDGGTTWQHVGLAATRHVGAVEVHPTDPDTAFVAAIGDAFQPSRERGIYRTRDGGQTWEHVLFLAPETGAVDLELHPADPDRIYACAWTAERKPWTIKSGGGADGVYRSTDGGDLWQKLDNGLPQGLVGKGDLAVSRADPDRVYVLLEAKDGPGLYRSDDAGDTFRFVSNARGLGDRPFYYTNVDADPSDADHVLVSATAFWQSKDGGASWRRVRTPHGDNHDLWIDPERPNVWVQGNDGGANVTLDGGASWSSQFDQPTAELYQVAIDDRFPYWLYAGQQDNSTIRVPSLPPYDAPAGPTAFWQAVGGCETGPAVPRPGDPDIVYAACKGKFGRYSFRTGQEQQFQVGAADTYGHDPHDLRFRFQRVAPIVVSPHDPSVIYHGSQFVHRSRDEGRSWEVISPDLTANEPDKQVISGEPITRDITGEEFYSTIYELAESTLERGVLWAGANDGPIHVTRDGGRTWRNVTPPQLPPGGRVQTIEPSPHRVGKAFACVLRYQLGDWQPHVWRTDDFGASWQHLSGERSGLPADWPTRVLREDPEREGLLYLGTERGVFVSFDDGARWQPLQANLPPTPVTDLVVHRGDLVLSTMGRSFWILDDITRLRQLTAAIAGEPLALFAPRPAFRMRYRPSREGSVPEYPPPGATIDYWLGADAGRGVVLEILDPDGRVLRTFASAAALDVETAAGDDDGDDAMSGIPRPRTPPTRLSAARGAHRFVWDLRHPTRDANTGRGGARAPLVAPGTYRVRVAAGGRSHEAPLEVRIDPRVLADRITADDLRAQETLALRVHAALADARELRDRVRASLADAEAERAAALRALEARLVDARGAYPQRMLIAQLRHLAGMLDAADQPPGADAFERFAELERELAACAEAHASAGGG